MLRHGAQCSLRQGDEGENEEENHGPGENPSPPVEPSGVGAVIEATIEAIILTATGDHRQSGASYAGRAWGALT
jgi:hypothetical protein